MVAILQRLSAGGVTSRSAGTWWHKRRGRGKIWSSTPMVLLSQWYDLSNSLGGCYKFLVITLRWW